MLSAPNKTATWENTRFPNIYFCMHNHDTTHNTRYTMDNTTTLYLSNPNRVSASIKAIPLTAQRTTYLGKHMLHTVAPMSSQCAAKVLLTETKKQTTTKQEPTKGDSRAHFAPCKSAASRTHATFKSTMLSCSLRTAAVTTTPGFQRSSSQLKATALYASR